MTQLTIHAPAKVNLALDITGLLPGGYHALDSVMLAAQLCDELTFTRGGAGVRLVCPGSSLPTDEGNLVLRAVSAFFAHTGGEPGGLGITLEKRIPMQAGLGGGSADAAATLRALRQLYAPEMSGQALAEVALEVGSDVPFCLLGGCARAQGRGEVLTPLRWPPHDLHLLIAKHAVGMGTRRAFALYDQNPPVSAGSRTGAMLAALETGDAASIGGAMSNVFEDVLPLPEVRRLKAAMLAGGALGACMTGSGTAVVGLFADGQSSTACAGQLREGVPFVWVGLPLV